MRPPRLACAAVCMLLSIPAAGAAPDPVTFAFRLPVRPGSPFARELWAEVVTPSQKTLRLPVFFAGGETFAVRARAEETGEYDLGKITEIVDGQAVTLEATITSRAKSLVRETEDRPPVRCAADTPARFVFATGETYTPIGANLVENMRRRSYRKVFEAFAEAGLNWTRLWMAHWNDLNLDWFNDDVGKSPLPGTLDLHVAAEWDQIISSAEEKGVYLQLVLQHHGQYSTGADANWRFNPWNVANGGFLRSPSDFFTSARAKEITRWKYRYVVARWGYSPAVLAWELFNEVHWVDAVGKERNEAAVAQWHSEMAASIRSIDVYGHLITTSTDNVRSPVYHDMDYYQPHNYPANMLVGLRLFTPSPDQLDRPVFYGEFGMDHMSLTSKQKTTGVWIVPAVWASLMGDGRYPAQPWQGNVLLDKGRLRELGAVARFLAATKLGGREELRCFSPAIESTVRVPLMLVGGQTWQRRPAPDSMVPVDGREPAAFGNIPEICVGSADSVADGFPDRATYRVVYPRPASARVRFANAGAAGAKARVQLDGATVAEHTWPARRVRSGAKARPRPAELTFQVAAGAHTIVIENPGGPDWIQFTSLDLGLETSILAAAGKRGGDFLAVWVWHRTGVFALQSSAPAKGTLLLEDVPAGTWRVTWWDTLNGAPAVPVTVEHPGGTLRLPTPPIARHAAVTLTR